MSKGTTGRSSSFPPWYKGRLLRETYGGFWYGEREGKLFTQEGKLVDKQMHDFITDLQRENAISSKIR